MMQKTAKNGLVCMKVTGMEQPDRRFDSALRLLNPRKYLRSDATIAELIADLEGVHSAEVWTECRGTRSVYVYIDSNNFDVYEVLASVRGLLSERSYNNVFFLTCEVTRS
jgi:hypothetical protein